jgi:dephospho-CoA kinase
VIYEAALLVETGRYKQLNGLIVIESSPELRRDRLIQRDGITPQLADQMIQSQTADDEKRRVATYLIQNTGTLDELLVSIREVVGKIRQSR